MNIAVIGDYESPGYQSFIEKIKLLKPEDNVLDLSRHPGYNWGIKCKARFDDISESHLVIIHPNYENQLDSRRDASYAMERKRECLIYLDGVFHPFPEYAKCV